MIVQNVNVNVYDVLKIYKQIFLFIIGTEICYFSNHSEFELQFFSLHQRQKKGYEIHKG